MLDNLEDIIQNRRSIRTFNNQPVDMMLVREIINIASHAPSNSNRQGWRFYAIKDKSTIEKIYSEVGNKLKSERVAVRNAVKLEHFRTTLCYALRSFPIIATFVD